MRRVAILLALCAACGGDSASPGPEILDLTLSAARLVPGQTLTVTVIVQPVDERTPVASGQLVRGSLALGSLTMTGSNTWQGETTWEQLVGSDLGGQMGQDVGTSASVRLFDSAGHLVERSFDLSLGCSASSEAVCGGACQDVREDFANCGGCGNDCTGELDGTDSSMLCRAGTCGVATPMASQRKSCDQVCAAASYHGQPLSCVPGCLETGNNSFSFNYGSGQQPGWAFYKDDPFTQLQLITLDSCAQVPAPAVSDLAYDWQRCCCVASFLDG